MNKKTITLIILTIAIVSCSHHREQNIINESKSEFQNERMSYIFDFPDTVVINKTYNGMIIYKNILDTISVHLANPDSIRDRYIIYSMAITNSLLSDKDLRKKVRDTFGAVDNRTIPLLKLKFTHPGPCYLDGYITDNGYIKIKGVDSTRIITNEYRITHRVIVK